MVKMKLDLNAEGLNNAHFIVYLFGQEIFSGSLQETA